MLLDWPSFVASKLKGAPYNTLIGTVVANNDPYKMGYVKARVPTLFSEDMNEDLLPWICPKFPNDGGGLPGSKSFRVPPIGAYVFLETDLNNPYNYYYTGWIPTELTQPAVAAAQSEVQKVLEDITTEAKKQEEQAKQEDIKDGDVTISFGPNTNRSAVSEKMLNILKACGKNSNNKRISITSTARDPYNQARIMYDNIVKNGIAEQRRTYARPGQQVLDAYQEAKSKGGDRSACISAMEARIKQIGPASVSKHCSDPNIINVVDLSCRVLSKPAEFLSQIRGKASRVLVENNCYHVELHMGGRSSFAYQESTPQSFIRTVNNSQPKIEQPDHYSIKGSSVQAYDNIKRGINTISSITNSTTSNIVNSATGISKISDKVNSVQNKVNSVQNKVNGALTKVRDLNNNVVDTLVKMEDIVDKGISVLKDNIEDITIGNISLGDLKNLGQLSELTDLIQQGDLSKIGSILNIPDFNNIDLNALKKTLENVDVKGLINSTLDKVNILSDFDLNSISLEGIKDIMNVDLTNILENYNIFDIIKNNRINDMLSNLDLNLVTNLDKILTTVSDAFFVQNTPVEANTTNFLVDYPKTKGDLDTNNNGFLSNEETKEYQFQHQGVILNIDTNGNTILKLPSKLKVSIGDEAQIDITNLFKLLAGTINIDSKSLAQFTGKAVRVEGSDSTIVKSSGGTTVKGSGVNIN